MYENILHNHKTSSFIQHFTKCPKYIIITPVIGYNLNAGLTVHNFHSKGTLALPTELTNFIQLLGYLVPIYTFGSSTSMWITHCLAEGLKCLAMERFEPELSEQESNCCALFT